MIYVAEYRYGKKYDYKSSFEQITMSNHSTGEDSGMFLVVKTIKKKGIRFIMFHCFDTEEEAFNFIKERQND